MSDMLLAASTSPSYRLQWACRASAFSSMSCIHFTPRSHRAYISQEFGADLDAVSPKGWTPLSYCKAKGKYGATEEKGIYPEVSSLALSVAQGGHICHNEMRAPQAVASHAVLASSTVLRLCRHSHAA